MSEEDIFFFLFLLFLLVIIFLGYLHSFFRQTLPFCWRYDVFFNETLQNIVGAPSFSCVIQQGE